MTHQAAFGDPVVWEPSQETIERAHLTRFMRRHSISSFSALHQRSISEPAWFTAALLDYLGISFRVPYEQVLDLSRGIAWPHWCVGARMNIVESCLDRWLEAGRGGSTALRWESESGASGSLTYDQLHAQVGRLANGLRSLGYSAGDCIGIYMPMASEIAVALLAIARIGAIALPLFSGYGAAAIATRLRDAGASGLLTANGFTRRGRVIHMKSIADTALADLPGVRQTIVLRHLDLHAAMLPGRDLWYDELISSQPPTAEAALLDAEAPLLYLYTSGTTGRPKGAVHTHCGFPVKAAQDMAFGTDVQQDDVIYWMTDMGWMMGPWLVYGALILGGAAMLYDGAPDYPDRDRLWSLCERHGVNVLGVSPTLIRSLMPHGTTFLEKHDLSALRCFASTGEPWNPAPWRWLFEQVGGGRLPIINYSGGTEVSGGILMGNPLMPLKPCAFSAACPGIWADVFDEQGGSLRGEVGELVIRTPWIGMTRGFLHDPQRYEQTYWSRWPEIWVHGDYALVDAQGSWFIFGRSDDTLKVAGKRIGPAEIESILIQHDQVVEAAVVGVPDERKGSSLVAFCVLKQGATPEPDLAGKLSSMVSGSMGKPMTPGAVFFVADLPKTRNAKVMRRVLRDAFLGVDPGDTSALVNPEVLEGLAELRAGGGQS